MRVAEISAFSNYSVGNIMRNIQQGLINNGHECKIFYSRGSKNQDDKLVNFGNKIGTYIAAIKARILDNDGFNCSFSTKKLIKILKEYNPDIVHLHCLHGYYINVKKLFMYLKKNQHIKVIWTMHDTWAITGHCCYFESYKCEKYKTLCHNCPAKKEYPTSILFDKSKRNYLVKKDIFNQLPKEQLTIVSPSAWLDNLISLSYLKEYNHVVINNGIATLKFKNYNLDRQNILLAVSSVWDRRKNLNRVLEISKNLTKWSVIIVGKIVDEIDKAAYPNIKFIDRTENIDQLVEIYNRSKIFINPTLDENFPTVNLEAQLCGMNVLSYDTGGCKETNLGNLYLFSETDFIDDVYLDGIDLKNTNEIDFNFTSENMCNQYIELMKKI